MSPSFTRRTPASLLLALTLATVGCAAAGGAAPPAAAPPALGSGERMPVAPAVAESARGRHTEADVHFMSAMIGHHAQAIVMAHMVPTHGASASVRTLAERILNSQRDEIASMQQWLRERGEPAPEVDSAGGVTLPAAHAGHGAGHAAHATHAMPGMLSEAQMRQLDAARGPEFDRLFLSFMIQHHQGAVTMVEELLRSPGAGEEPAVFKLAADINVDQTTEIERMQRMLAALVLGTGAP